MTRSFTSLVSPEAVKCPLEALPETESRSPLPDGLFVEFSDPAPTAILVMPVATTSIEGVEVPRNAISYAFYEYANDDVRFVGPHVFLSEAPEVASGEELVANGLASEQFVRSWEESHGAEAFGVVTWDEETSSPAGKLVIPLVDGMGLAERGTGRQVWPSSQEPAP